MTTDELVALLEERHLRLTVAADGTPVLRGPVNAATPALLRVVALHRAALAARCKAQAPARGPAEGGPATGRPREYLWADGRAYRESPRDAHLPMPARAEWWRYVGEPRWRPTKSGDAKGG